ncbi:cytochrome P450 [Nocardia sp. NPDC052112]|uniref:cytochrome P450 n=1 Tax=Nocardia sp. NPDC052112 TaxID=3155646 RepID=UPI00343C4B84
MTDLRALDDLVPDWSRDIVETSQSLFRQGVTGLLAGPENSLVVIRNTDVKALAANPHVGNIPAEFLLYFATEPGRSGMEPNPEEVEGFGRFLRNQVFTSNPPLHTYSRRIVARQLMPRQIGRFTPIAERLVRELVDESAEHDEIEFSREFASRFVTRFWSELLGLTRDQATQLEWLMEEMSLSFPFTRTPEQSRRLYSAAAIYMDMVGEAVRQARSAGDNELLAEMANELDEVDIEGKPEDIGALVAANFFDGFHTIGVGITNVMYRMLIDQSACARVQSNRALVTNTFLEGTRLEPPLMLSHRIALQDLEYDGVFIPLGTPIGMAWAAANRDPLVFDDADSYRLNRQIRGATFGGGVHLCPGRNVVQMLTVTAVTALTSPDVDITLAGRTHEWIPHTSMRQLAALPVSIRRKNRT